MNSIHSNAAANTALVALICLVTGSCESASPTEPIEPIGPAVAFDRWAPGPEDTCSADIHNQYSVVGADGYVYPTWHPPIDPATGCSFGHEHGRDPHGSDMYDAIGPIPFGVANQALDVFQPGGMRHEDHVGHKIEWENDVRMDFDGGAAAALEVRCDVLYKMHQGSHSKDAFTNNLHEVVLHARCSDGTEVHITMLAAIGEPGEFVVSCDRERHIQVGTASPPTSPAGGGKRAIPDRSCIERHMLVAPGDRSNYNAALRESWETSNSLRRSNGRLIAHFNPYFQVLDPSRYFDPTMPNNVGRPIDACYEVTPDGRKAEGGHCEASTGEGALDGVTFDDTRSTFRGAQRFVDVNNIRVMNANGPEVWYTDPFGRNGQTEPFPGSVRQLISRVDNTGRVGNGPAIGRNRVYGVSSVHAPN